MGAAEPAPPLLMKIEKRKICSSEKDKIKVLFFY